MAKVGIRTNAQVAIKSVTLLGETLKVGYDLYYKDADDCKLNSEPLEMTLHHADIVDLKEEGAKKLFNADKSNVKVTYDSIGQFIMASDPFFQSLRTITSEVERIMEMHLNNATS